MKWTQEISDRILGRLKEKIPNAKCPMCGSANWKLNGPFSPIVLQEEFAHYNVVGKLTLVPCVALGCQVCGDTHLMNLLVIAPDILEMLASTGSSQEKEEHHG